MSDFRKWFPAMALVAVILLTSGIANAQNWSCEAQSGAPPLLRQEGQAELTGDVVIECRALPGAENVNVNIQIFLTTNITSRLLSSGGNITEAMLIQGIAPPAFPAAIPAADSILAQRFSDNSVVWLNVPLVVPTEENTVRRFRLTNVRANANMAQGGSSIFFPTEVKMLITISTPLGQSVTLANNTATQVVGAVHSSMEFKATGCAGTGSANTSFLQCNATNAPVSTSDSNTTNLTRLSFGVAFTEKFGTAFRNEAGEDGRAREGSSIVGQATQGTRFIARFTNIPAGANLYASRTQLPASQVSGVLVTGSVDSAGAGGSFAGSSSTLAFCGTNTTPIQVVALTKSGSTAIAVWEVTDASPVAIETALFGIMVSYTPGGGLPALGTADVTGDYAPFNAANVNMTMSFSAPVPRFVQNPANATTFTINPCQTNLLFPFVAAGGGFDTGLAIANTSKDIFNTSVQSGPCTIHYFPMDPANAAVVPSQTSKSIVAGDTLSFSMTGGSAFYGITERPNFVGYVIAKCNFQYAHGYAFISDLGANKFAQGYLALILDDPIDGPSRTGVQSEPKNN